MISYEVKNCPHLHSNLRGYLQHRKLIEQEHIEEFRPTQDIVDSWQIPEEVFALEDNVCMA